MLLICRQTFQGVNLFKCCIVVREPQETEGKLYKEILKETGFDVI